MNLLFFIALCYVSALRFYTKAYPTRWSLRGNSGTSGQTWGDQSLVESDSVVSSNGRRDYFAESFGRGSASGFGNSKGDLESWADFDGWQSGKSGARGQSVGDQTAVDFTSKVHVGWGGSESLSRSTGTASGRGLSRVDLESFAGLNGLEGGGVAGASAVGNQASSSAGATAARATNNQLAVGSSGSASSVSTLGKGGARSHAGAKDNFGRGLRAASEGRGAGALVVSGSQSNAALLNSKLSGKSHGYSRSSGPGSSYASSAASLRVGG